MVSLLVFYGLLYSSLQYERTTLDERFLNPLGIAVGKFSA